MQKSGLIVFLSPLNLPAQQDGMPCLLSCRAAMYKQTTCHMSLTTGQEHENWDLGSSTLLVGTALAHI